MATNQERGGWNPDYAVPPGAVLAEYVEARGWSQADLARRLGRSPKMISEIISGKNPIEPDTALALERVLGMKAEIWSGMEADWRTFQAREADRLLAAERTSWIRGFPLAALRKAGVLPAAGDPASKDAAKMRESVLAFFGVASEDAFEARWSRMRVAYRHSSSHRSDAQALRTWLRLGERTAESIEAPPFDEAAASALLPRLRALTLKEPEVFVPSARALCLRAGVIVALVPRLDKACLSGAAYRRPDGRGVIQLSLRHKSNDHFWFTFFHELGHLVLHRGVNFFADDDASDLTDGKQEREADEWAEEGLVGRARLGALCRRNPQSASEVEAFAREVGVHPGVVVGMLQHRNIVPWTNLNRLKQKLDVEACARLQDG